jgi:hypothetical protein
MCATLYVLLAGALFGQDWEGFGASSDRSADPIILQTMATADLETNVALCKGLARRSDQDVGAIIDFLASGHAAKTTAKTELLLRYLLQGVLDARSQPAALLSWVEANAVPLDGLLARISQWKDPQLKGALLSFAVIAPGSQGMHAIMDTGAAVVQELESSDGLIPSEDAALGLDFLSAAQRTGRSDFFSYCAAIARLSRDKVLVDAARAAAAQLARAP